MFQTPNEQSQLFGDNHPRNTQSTTFIGLSQLNEKINKTTRSNQLKLLFQQRRESELKQRSTQICQELLLIFESSLQNGTEQDEFFNKFEFLLNQEVQDKNIEQTYSLTLLLSKITDDFHLIIDSTRILKIYENFCFDDFILSNSKIFCQIIYTLSLIENCFPQLDHLFQTFKNQLSSLNDLELLYNIL